jgi:microcin C transport system ATP-binding protein
MRSTPKAKGPNDRAARRRGLRVAFGGKEVVHGIDFSIQRGEKLALVGESGSGKTVTALSLLKLALNADVPAGAFDGRDLLALPERELLRGIRGSDIAMIFQEPMTALNPLFHRGRSDCRGAGAQAWGWPPPAAQAVVELLASTGIAEPARRAQAFPHQLSAGSASAP